MPVTRNRAVLQLFQRGTVQRALACLMQPTRSLQPAARLSLRQAFAHTAWQNSQPIDPLNRVAAYLACRLPHPCLSRGADTSALCSVGRGRQRNCAANGYDVNQNFYNPNLPEYASCSKLEGNFCQNWGGECANGTLLQPQNQRRYGFHCGTCDLNFFLNMTRINPANINEVRSHQLYVMWGFNNAGNHNRNMYSSPSIAQYVCQPCPVGTGSPHNNVSSRNSSPSLPPTPR